MSLLLVTLSVIALSSNHVYLGGPPTIGHLDLDASIIEVDPQSISSLIGHQDLFIENLGQQGEGGGSFYCEGRTLSVSFGTGWFAYHQWRADSDGVVSGTLIRIEYENGNSAEPVGIDQRQETYNYFIGSESDRWVAGARAFEEVFYQEVWEGIDIRFYFQDSELKYDIIIHPDSDPAQISFRIEGNDKVSINERDGLVISTPMGEIHDDHPFAYYRSSPEITMECGFRLTGSGTYGIRLGEYDSSRTLVIDPLIYSTYFGGPGGPIVTEYGYDVVADSNGCAYVTGSTQTNSFPTTPGAYQTDYDNYSDAFVTKLNDNGTGLVFSTLLGGSSRDDGTAILINDDGTTIVSGFTQSEDFPFLPGAYNGSRYSFMCKLSADGSELLFSIQGAYAGCMDDESYFYFGGLRDDGYGNRYSSVNKMTPNADGLILSMEYQIDQDNGICGLAVDKEHNVYLVGRTDTDNLTTTPGAFQSDRKGAEELYVMKLSSDFTTFEYVTYLGGSGYEHPYDMAVDESGHVFITGRTSSSDFPTTDGAFQRSFHYDSGSTDRGADVFVTKLSADGKSLEYSTFIGGDQLDTTFSIDIDGAGHAFITGRTSSSDFPVTEAAFQSELNASTSSDPEDDGFVCMLNYNGSSLLYSTYFGGEDMELSYGISVDQNGTIYLTGRTNSDNFPTTPGAYRTDFGYMEDAFILKLDPDINITSLYFDQGPRLFAGYRDYHFRVNGNPMAMPSLAERVGIILDPGGAEVSVVWNDNGTGNPFKIENDPENYVEVVSDARDSRMDGINNTLVLDFRIIFNWNWPHEEPCDVIVKIDNETRTLVSHTTHNVFSVENDLDFIGEPSSYGQWQGNLSEGDWVRGNENVTLSGPIVVYEGTTDTYPPDDTFKIALLRTDGNLNTSGFESGKPVEVTLQMGNETKVDEILTLALENLPGTAEVKTNPTYSLRVDGDPPLFRNIIPEEENWQSSNDVMVSIIVDDSNTSGVNSSNVEYSYSTDGPLSYQDWTRAGLAVSPSGDIVDAMATITLPDGDSNFIRWRAKDIVGNGYSISDHIRIRVDSHNVTFTDPVPGADTWQTVLNVTCGVTISDIEGSGIDVSSIQYRVSERNLSRYGEWFDWDYGDLDDHEAVVTIVDVSFNISSYNYIQWRAMDLAGNGFTASSHYRVGVDVDPIWFHDFEPMIEGFIMVPSPRVSIGVADNPKGSGVDLSAIEYCIYQGDEGQTRWISVGMDGTAIDTIFSMVPTFPDGIDNRIRFRGWDVAGNGPSLSDEYSFSVDTSTPIFRHYGTAPLYHEAPGKMLVKIELWDELSGLNTSSVQYRYRRTNEQLTMEWTTAVLNPQGVWYGVELRLVLIPGAEYEFMFRAYDMAGHEGLFETGRLYVNAPPVAVITKYPPGRTFEEGEIIDLDGSGSTDPDGDDLEFVWEVWQNGTLVIMFKGEAVMVKMGPGLYTIRLDVSDGQNVNATDEIEIRVAPVPEPRTSSEGFGSTTILLVIFVVIIGTIGLLVWYLKYRETDSVR